MYYLAFFQQILKTIRLIFAPLDEKHKGSENFENFWKIYEKRHKKISKNELF